MADVKVRKLPDWVLATLRVRVEGRSVEEELRHLLTAEAGKPKKNRAAEMAALRKMLQKKYGTLSDHTRGVRRERDARS